MANKTNKPEIWDAYQTVSREAYSGKSGKNDPTYYYIIDLLKEKKIVNCDLMEIGFGNGKTLELLSSIFKWVCGADISPKNIEITRDEFLKKKIANADFRVVDLMNESEVKVKYDVVLVNHVLEHFRHDELIKVVENLKKLLKNGGKVVGAVPHKLPLTYRICPNCGHSFEQDGHQISYTLDEFENTFKKLGFKNVETRGYNISFLSRNDNMIKKIIRMLYYNMTKQPIMQIEFCMYD
ncbi:MAG: class I SAM-dependent methyltransferase [Bacteroidia bacterium]|nr:class I SAM-dependent methyltransferase [Bacteroidia bacterium]